VVTIEAGVDVQVGDRAFIPVTLAYDGQTPKAGLSLTVSVVETKLPAVKPNAPSIVKVERGVSKTVSVLDGVFDPWAKEKPAQITNVQVSGDATASVSGQGISVLANTAKNNNNVAVTFMVEDGVGRTQVGSFAVVVRDRPDAPTSVTAVPGILGEAQISWAPVVGTAANGEPVESYRVTLAGATCPDATGGQTSTVCHMGGLSYGQQYTVEVRARNQVGESDPGVGQLDYQIPPAPPVAGAAEANIAYNLHLTWQAGTEGGTTSSYVISCNGSVMVDGIGGTSVTLTELVAGRSYACQVQSRNEVGLSPPAMFPAITVKGPPGQPSPPDVAFRDTSTVTVTWSEVAYSGTDVDYKLLYGTSNVEVTGCGRTSCDVPLAPGAAASFKVKVTSQENSTWTSTSDVAGPFRQAPASIEALTTPSAVSTPNRDAGQGQITVTWQSIAPVPNFGIDRTPTVDGNGISLGANAWSHGPTSVNDLPPGTYAVTDHYCLTSDYGVPMVPGSLVDLCSQASTAVTVTTKPSAPQICSASRPSDTEVEVTCARPSSDGGLGLTWRYNANSHDLGGAQTYSPSDPNSPMVTFTVTGVTSNSGYVSVWAENAQGASPRTNVPYAVWTSPAPGTPGGGGSWSASALVSTPADLFSCPLNDPRKT
jgi:hypothetical protein